MKIERVINDCCECRFAKEFQERGGNTDFVLICTQNEDDSTSGFMITRSRMPIKGREFIEIPKQCPLQDFTPAGPIQIDKPK